MVESVDNLINKWKNYVCPDDLDKLQMFCEKTNQGEPTNEILILTGTGNNGKSTFLTELQTVIGYVNCWQVCLNDFAGYSSKNNFLNPTLAKITNHNYKLLFANEAETHDLNNSAVVLRKIILNEQIKCRGLYEKTTHTKSITSNVILCTNNINITFNVDSELSELITLVRFTHTF